MESSCNNVLEDRSVLSCWSCDADPKDSRWVKGAGVYCYSCAPVESED